MARKEVCRKNMRAFPREVASRVLHLIKDHEVRARMIDGGHVFLYGENRAVLKVSGHRPAKDSLCYLGDFVSESGLECEH